MQSLLSCNVKVGSVWQMRACLQRGRLHHKLYEIIFKQ